MAFGSFRFDDTKHMEDLRKSGSAIHGLLSSTRCSKQKPEPWAVPTKGITGKEGRADPISELRRNMLRDFGFRPACIFPNVSDDWTKVARATAKYAVVRRRLTTLAEA